MGCRRDCQMGLYQLANCGGRVRLHEGKFYLVEVRAVISAQGCKRNVARSLRESHGQILCLVGGPVRGCCEFQFLRFAAPHLDRQASGCIAPVRIRHGHLVFACRFGIHRHLHARCSRTEVDVARAGEARVGALVDGILDDSVFGLELV